MASYPPLPPPLPPPDGLQPSPGLLPPPPPPMPPSWQPSEATGWRAWSSGKKALLVGAVVVGALVALGVLRSLTNPGPNGGRPTFVAPGPTPTTLLASPTPATPTASVPKTPTATPTPDTRPAAFELSDLFISPSWAALGAPVAVSIDVLNSGGLSGSYVVELTIDDAAVESQEVTVEGGASKTVTFAVADLPLGAHVIDVNGETYELKIADIQRPESGTMLINKGRKGQGHLTVENGTTRDAVVALTRAGNLSKTPVAVYIRAGSTETVKRIGDGTYVIFYGFGTDWDAFSQHFLTDADYGRFSDELLFETTDFSLPGWRLTLQPVVGGNAPTDDIGEGDFPAFGGEDE